MVNWLDDLPAFAEKYRKEHPEEFQDEPLTPLQPMPGTGPSQGLSGPAPDASPSPAPGMGVPQGPDNTPLDPGWADDWKKMWQQQDQQIPPPPPTPGSPFPGRREEVNAGGLLGNLASLTGGGGGGLLGGAGFDMLKPPDYPTDLGSIPSSSQYAGGGGHGGMPPGPRSAAGGDGMPLDASSPLSMMNPNPQAPGFSPDMSLLGSGGGDTLGGGSMGGDTLGAAADDGSNPSFFNRLFGGGGNDRLGGNAWGPALMQLGAGIAAGSTEGWGAGIGKGLGLAGASLQKSKEQAADEAYRKQVLAMKQAELDKKAEGPTSVQEYEYLKAHPEAAAFFEQRSKAGGTTIYTGEDGSALPTPEAGHAYAHGPDGKVLMRQVEGQPEGVLAPVSVPIFGSKAAGEQESAQKASDKRASEEKRTANIMSEDIGRGIDIINQNEGVTGFPGEVSKNIPGTPSHNLAKLLDGVKANIGFDRLQQMRAASPTGAALGSVQVRELEMLQSVWGSVEQSQTRDQLRYNLNRLRIATDEVVNGPGGAQQQQQQQPKIPTAEEYFGGR